MLGRAAGHRSAAAASLLHRRRRRFAESPLAAVATGLRGASSTEGESASGIRVGGLGALALAGSSLLAGYLIGTSHQEHLTDLNKDRELPKGERGCCSCDSPTEHETVKLTEAQAQLAARLERIVGKGYVVDGKEGTSSNRKFLKGARLGQGTSLCIVQPGTLGQAIRALQEIVDAGCVVLPQGSNTGLTGGSVPRNDNGDSRPVVVMSLKRLQTHFPIDDGKRVVCLAGTGISTLASSIQEWFPDRESHSILGSTFLNPTTAAGVAFGSGGTLVRKGPARTDRALYCKVYKNKFGEHIVSVVNTLGIEGLEEENFQEGAGNGVDTLDSYCMDVKQGYRRPMMKSSHSKHGQAKASDTEYSRLVCECSKEVSRFNADTKGEDCNRSEGKVVILATVHDTFPVPSEKRVFFLSFPDFETCLDFRRKVILDNPEDLPISCEYLDRDSIDIIDRAGRISTFLIRFLGMGDIMSTLWNVKNQIEGLPFSWAPMFCDKFLHAFNNFVPCAIPSKFMTPGKDWDHHCLVAVGEFGNGTLPRFMERLDKFVKQYNDKALGDGTKVVSVVEAESESDVTALNAFRFVAALAFKTYCVGEDIQGISVDYSLPKNGGVAPTLLPHAATPLKRMRYSHLGCNVVHEDIAYALGVDTHKEKMGFKQTVEELGGKLPAEHGHGTEYHAPLSAQTRWMTMDPENLLNPGIGGLSALPRYGK